jgi:ABC-2 type transport system permease protein
VNVIYVSDIDFISDSMFSIVEKESYNLKLDNVAFVLNCVDSLAGDTSLVELRKRRPHQRTLSAVEAQTVTYQRKRREAEEEAEKAAEGEIDDVRKRLKAEQAKLTDDKTLDPAERGARMQMLVQEEQTKLVKKQVEVETRKQAKLNQARNETTRQVQGVELRYRILAMILPPIPALLIGCWVFLKRMADERRTIGTDRLVAR